MPTWEIPAHDLVFLQDLASKILTQDNAGTADPLFIVEQRERVYGFDEAYSDNVVFIDCEGYTYDPAGDPDNEEEPPFDPDDPPDHLTWTAYEDRWVFVCAHMTRAAADLYIEQNRHRLKAPRVYTTSQYRCHEYNRLVKILRAFAV